MRKMGFVKPSAHLLFLAMGMAAGSAAGAACRLRVNIQPEWDGAPLVRDAFSLTNEAGQVFSVARLDLFVSDFSLHQKQGGWLAHANGQAFLSMSQARTHFDVEKLAPGDYDKVRFYVGLRREINHSAPGQYPPGHALNPALSGMYSNEPIGYIFFAVAGQWLRGSEAHDYSFSLEGDAMLVTVELPVSLRLTRNQPLNLTLSVRQLFTGNPFQTIRKPDSSPARNSPFQAQLKTNVQRAISLSQTAYAPPAPKPFALVFPREVQAPDLPRDNPLTEEGVRLGRRLFGERLLSINGRQSCISCHHPQDAFSQEGRRVSIGAEGQRGERNSMPIFNLAWKTNFFWDGRAPTLRAQVVQPIQNPIEMHETLPHVVAKLSATENYPEQFERVFGPGGITTEKIAKALEQFLLTRLAFDSKFDQAHAGKATLTPEEERGYQLFSTEYVPAGKQMGAGCFHCHGGPFFRNQDFANNGLDFAFKDLGRYNATKKESDKGKFAVPSLRNVEVTGPYMHDGRFVTLEAVVEHYATGIKMSQTLDPQIAGRRTGGVPLSQEDKRALVAFLKTLTDERFHFVPPPRPFDAAFRR